MLQARKKTTPAKPKDIDLKVLLDTPPWDWPMDTSKRITETLRNKQASASERLVAAELARECVVIDEEMIRELLDILSRETEPEDLRSQAAISLGPVLATCDFEEQEELPIPEPLLLSIQECMHTLFMDGAKPKALRRKVLEASVNKPEDWHKQAIRSAFASADDEWKLSAVSCMKYVDGCTKEILEALKSSNPNLLCEAIRAADYWEITEAWPRISSLVKSTRTPKPLLLAAIDACASICPEEAIYLLQDLTESQDGDIAEAAEEAIFEAEAKLYGYDEDDFDDDFDDDDDSESYTFDEWVDDDTEEEICEVVPEKAMAGKKSGNRSKKGSS